jgi:hypothetical protein
LAKNIFNIDMASIFQEQIGVVGNHTIIIDGDESFAFSS